MAVSVIMPKAGMAMEEGTIIKWLKAEGDTIEQGEPLLEIMTDKVNMEVEAQASGVLLKILKSEGEVVLVTNVIGYIGKSGEQISNATSDETKVIEAPKVEAVNKMTKEIKLVSSSGKIAATPVARRLASLSGIDLAAIDGTGSHGEIKARDVLAFKDKKATPLAKRIAEANGVDISQVSGSGHGGKIVSEDINKIMHAGAFDENKEEKTVPDIYKITDRKPLRGMRKIIADRMSKSHTEIPPVTLNAKADVTELSAMREKVNNSMNIKVTYNDFVLKAAAIALKEYQNVNASINGEYIEFKKEVNVGMAVALEEGLIVPVIKNTDSLSIKEISSKAKELAKAAREGKLLPDNMSGGTFTVSNLGMYDIISFTPIINQPESAILGVCAIEEELKIIESKVEVRKVMGLSLTFDHRVIDGAQGAIFLKKIKNLLENPLEMLI